MSLNLLPAACKPRATPDHSSVCLVSFRDLKKKIFNFYLIWLSLFCFSFISHVKWLCGSRSWCGVLVAQIIPWALLKNPNAEPVRRAECGWVDGLQPSPSAHPVPNTYTSCAILILSTGGQRCKMDWNSGFVCVWYTVFICHFVFLW